MYVDFVPSACYNIWGFHTGNVFPVREVYAITSDFVCEMFHLSDIAHVEVLVPPRRPLRPLPALCRRRWIWLVRSLSLHLVLVLP